MITRRGSQYSTQSDEAGLRSRITPLKGKQKGKISSETESTQESAILQRQVPEMPIISEPELELSIGNSNRYKLHSEGSDRPLHQQVQAIFHDVQGQGLGKVATNPPRSDELLEHPEKAPQQGRISEILQWMESIIIQTSNQKDKGLEQIKEGRKKGRSPSIFYQKATSQPTSSRREEEHKKELEETIFPRLQGSNNPKRFHVKCLQHWKKLHGIKGNEGQRMRPSHFPKK
ncbi:hypothetical protein O181_025217 [Austropuccinia psidii MF-1]|uniref:Uncharacterized protein n=1 Tax=Austropuccinia psidii MF-1 TaxID=1389203 RepID=A0A9Q3GZN4_9BASI|nr:hypothetical protein [Austropuccinia psidii MF-1]